MTEKKIHTVTQMKEYRQLKKTMSSQADYDKVFAFEQEYDDFEIAEHEYVKVFKNGKEGYIDEDGRFSTEEDMRFFHADID